jgi:hypothetical protein
MCGYATGLAPKLFFTPVVNLLFPLYPSHEVGTNKHYLSFRVATPAQASKLT